MSGHLRGDVRAYVDRSLPHAALVRYDRHLVCCASCRFLADQERRIVASLRADTGVPASLRTSLMSLASAPPSDVPPVPVRPSGLLPAASPLTPRPLPTIAPSAPAQHRSPVRAAVVAGLAASASVAAAWGLATAPVPGGAGRVPTPGATGPASVSPASLAPAQVLRPRQSAGTVWSTATRPADSAAPARLDLGSSAESRP